MAVALGFVLNRRYEQVPGQKTQKLLQGRSCCSSRLAAAAAPYSCQAAERAMLLQLVEAAGARLLPHHQKP